MAQQNTPDLWRSEMPQKRGAAHKYDYGHALIYGADGLSGATRLAAGACARMGVGLTTVLCNPAIADVYRTSVPAHIMVREGLTWSDPRVTARLYGPGGLPRGVKISQSRRLVLDAEAILARPERLDDRSVLTPHDGEFARAFPNIYGTTREEKALKAAQESGAVIVLKGAETVIAHPDGRVAVNAHASPYLATAGSGDVLAGMITGLLAQGMPGFEAACASVWIHGDAALKFGPGLVASDLVDFIPRVLKGLHL